MKAWIIRMLYLELFLLLLSPSAHGGALPYYFAHQLNTPKQFIKPLFFATGGFAIVQGWDGSTVFNVGDLANTALRVNVVAGGAGGGAVTQSTGAGAATDYWNVRLTDGAAFLPLPTALAGGGGLKVECLSGCGGAAAFADASAFTFGTTSVGIFAAVVDDVATNTVAENSAGTPRMNTNRVLYTMNTNSTGVEIGTAGAPLRVDPTGSTIQPVSGTVTVTDGSGALNVIVDSSALPSGAATAALQTQPGVDIGDVTVNNGTGAAAVNIQDGGNIITVDGTVAATQSGTWNVTNISGTVSLPTGASTLTEQQTQTTALQIIDNLPVAQGSTTSGQSGALVQGAVTTSAPSYTTAQTSPLSLQTDGDLRVEIEDPILDVRQATAANLNIRSDTSGATAAAPPARADFIGGVTSGATGGFLGGITVCDSWVPVDIVTATTVLAVTGVSGRHVYICSINLVTAGANNVAIVAGTGATCGTSTAGMNGGVTSGEGWNFAANGGIAQGSGLGAIMRTETTGDSVCIITSAAVQLSGAIGYAIY